MQSSFEEEDEWNGVVSEAYNTGSWVYIGDAEELQVWQRPDSKGSCCGDFSYFIFQFGLI